MPMFPKCIFFFFYMLFIVKLFVRKNKCNFLKTIIDLLFEHTNIRQGVGPPPPLSPIYNRKYFCLMLFGKFSSNWPTGPIQSLVVAMSVCCCLFACCHLFKY